jgi:hypothetical protein
MRQIRVRLDEYSLKFLNKGESVYRSIQVAGVGLLVLELCSGETAQKENKSNAERNLQPQNNENPDNDATGIK